MGRKSPLQLRNVRVKGRRTSMRLEPLMWEALDYIARREQTDLDSLCTQVHDRHPEQPLSSSMRVFALHYFWEVARRGEAMAPCHGSVFSGKRLDGIGEV